MIRPPNSYRHLLVTIAAFLAASTPLLATVATWNGQWPPVAGSYNAAVDGNVPISAIVQGTPARITLTLHRPGGYQLYRKAPDATSWGDPIATLPAGSTSYIDNNVSVGVPYEYRAMMTGTTVAARVPNGYIMAGIQVDRTAPRGRVVLVVSDTIAARLPAELDAYKRDLGAEGWTVHTLSVAAVANYSGTGNFHQPVRAQIQALNAQYPGEIKNVILLGKVPMARTGLSDGIRPDGHDNSYAEASDAYFAEMDGNWTDTGSNGQSGDVGNVPGDGKFDQFNVSLASGGLGTGQRVEFGYGRIDTSFYQASEVETTRMYLNKLARYRRAADDFQAGRRAVLRKGASLN